MKRILVSFALGIGLIATPMIASAQEETSAEILAHYKNEPTAAETINAALDYSGLNGDRLESMYKRAAGSKALPKKLSYEFTGRYRDTDRPQTKTTYGGTDDIKNLTQTVNTDYIEEQDYDQHKIHAEWELSGLVFNKEQLDVYKAMASSATSRNKLIKEISDLYFKRRALQVQVDTDSELDVMARLQIELQIQQITAEIDGRTGGWFSKALRSGR